MADTTGKEESIRFKSGQKNNPRFYKAILPSVGLELPDEMYRGKSLLNGDKYPNKGNCNDISMSFNQT